MFNVSVQNNSLIDYSDNCNNWSKTVDCVDFLHHAPKNVTFNAAYDCVSDSYKTNYCSCISPSFLNLIETTDISSISNNDLYSNKSSHCAGGYNCIEYRFIMHYNIAGVYNKYVFPEFWHDFKITDFFTLTETWATSEFVLPDILKNFKTVQSPAVKDCLIGRPSGGLIFAYDSLKVRDITIVNILSEWLDFSS